MLIGKLIVKSIVIGFFTLVMFVGYEFTEKSAAIQIDPMYAGVLAVVATLAALLVLVFVLAGMAHALGQLVMKNR